MTRTNVKLLSSLRSLVSCRLHKINIYTVGDHVIAVITDHRLSTPVRTRSLSILVYVHTPAQTLASINSYLQLKIKRAQMPGLKWQACLEGINEISLYRYYISTVVCFSNNVPGNVTQWQLYNQHDVAKWL